MAALIVAVVVVVIATVAVPLFARRTIRRHDVARPDLPTGADVAARIVRDHDLGAVPIEAGDVDAYFGVERTIRLADGRLDRSSVSAGAIAAHEAAHLMQHASGYRPWRIWWVLAVPALIADLLFFPLSATLLLTDWSALVPVIIATLAVVAVSGAASVVVEVNASRRALAELRAQSLGPVDLAIARRILIVAGATYVAEAILDLDYFLRWLPDNDSDGGFSDQGGSGDDGGGGHAGGGGHSGGASGGGIFSGWFGGH